MKQKDRLLISYPKDEYTQAGFLKDTDAILDWYWRNMLRAAIQEGTRSRWYFFSL